MCSGGVFLPCKAHLDAFFLPFFSFGKKRALKVGAWFIAEVFSFIWVQSPSYLLSTSIG